MDDQPTGNGAPTIVALPAVIDAANADEVYDRLRLVIPPGTLTRRVLVLMGADHLLPVYSSVGEACSPPAGPQDPLAAYLPPAGRLSPKG